MLKKYALVLMAFVMAASVAWADDAQNTDAVTQGLLAKTSSQPAAPAVSVDVAQHVMDGLSINFKASHVRAAKAGGVESIDVPSQDDKDCVRQQVSALADALKAPEFKAELQQVALQSVHMAYQLVDGTVGKNDVKNPVWEMRLNETARQLNVVFYRDDAGCKVVDAQTMVEAARVAQDQRQKNAYQWSSEISALSAVLGQLKSVPAKQ